MYEVKTTNECFNIFVISNYGPNAPVHIGVKITDTLSIEDPNKPYILSIEWYNQAGYKKSHPLDIRDINSYSQETMSLVGKADDKSSMQVQTVVMDTLKE
ncbi:hypothetical protein [Rhabdochlamydiaceae symbiont of Dictyostelium giganteum]|uniref:hypothetical protein n=1 Tax=Rhabdochlamydiaceae symbiont of Dictyostelium giganteum TaxID=3342349 RepID=UPI00384E03CC